MAKLSQEQIQRLNQDLEHGVTLTTIHNTRYHFIVKINPEAITIQSMLAEDSDSGFIINLSDMREQLDKKHINKPDQYEEVSQDSK